MTTPRERDPRFDEWYALYPRKVARKAAEKAWAKLAPSDALVEQIMAGLRAQLPAWARKPKSERQFIPHPSTWLNQMRWLDEGEAYGPVPRVVKCAECADTEQVIVGPPVLEIRRCSCHRYAGETLQKIHPDDWREYERIAAPIHAEDAL